MATHTTRPHPPPLARWQRALLPAMLGADRADRGASGGSDLPRSLRDWLVDVVMFLGSLGIGAAAIVSERHNVSTAWWIASIAIGLPALGALWIRRRRPLAVAVLTIVIATVSGLATGAAIVGVFTAGVYCPPRRSLQVFALSLASAGIYPWLYGQDHHGHYDPSSLVFQLFCFVVAFVFGSFVRVRRELVLSLRERNRELQAEQARRVAQAQLAERSRIAREMHDVLAHRISLLSVHAGALEFHPDASPEEIARAAKIIRESARAAQEELREVIGVLRTDPGDPVDRGGAEGPIEPPQPTLTDLDRLVEESRQAGMEVRLATALDSGPLGPTLGRTVYRFVQEALTNARKHAPGQVVAIVVAGGRHTGVRVSVTNQPAVGRAATTGRRDATATAPAPSPDHVGSGAGLIGLRERVALAGGTLTHEPLPAGGFRVSATLPWGPES